MFRRTSPAPGTQQSPGSGEQDGCPEETLLLCGSALKKRVNTGGHLGEAEAGVCLQPERGQRPGSLGQVFHRQLLLQVPVVGNCHILGGGGQQRDGPAVILSLSWFLLHVHGVAAAGGRAGLSPPPHGDGPAGTQLSAPSPQVTSDCPSVGAMSHRGHRAVPSSLLQPHTPQERGCPPVPPPHQPVLLRGQARAAAAVAVDLLHRAADVVVAHVQHPAGGAGVDHGGAVEQREAALCQRRLQRAKGYDGGTPPRCSGIPVGQQRPLSATAVLPR